MTTTAPATTTLTEPVEVVTEFLRRLHARDLTALDLVHEDLQYVNVPLTWSRSRNTALWGLRANFGLEQLVRPVDLHWELRVKHIAATGDGVVLTERTDILRLAGMEFSIWCCGHAEVVDGKIAVWRDYLDYVDLAAAVPRGLWRSLLRKKV